MLNNVNKINVFLFRLQAGLQPCSMMVAVGFDSLRGNAFCFFSMKAEREAVRGFPLFIASQNPAGH